MLYLPTLTFCSAVLIVSLFLPLRGSNLLPKPTFRPLHKVWPEMFDAAAPVKHNRMQYGWSGSSPDLRSSTSVH